MSYGLRLIIVRSMRVLLLRLLAILTALTWLGELSRAVPVLKAGGSVGGFIPIALVICFSIAAALYSVVWPTRWGAITLLVTSELPAGFLAYEAVSRFSEGGAAYVRRGLELLSLPSAVCFITLPIIWAAAYWSVRKAPVRDLTSAPANS